MKCIFPINLNKEPVRMVQRRPSAHFVLISTKKNYIYININVYFLALEIVAPLFLLAVNES